MAIMPNVELSAFDQLLSQLIAENSISSTDTRWDQSNESVIRVLASWFEKLGFRCQVTPLSTDEKKFNLVATLGEGARGLVLAGHTDTVPYDQAKWDADPFAMRYQNERFYGLGTCDMKGFFPIIVEALRGLSGAALQQPLIIVATADEESSMNGARDLAGYGSVQARAAIIGEPTSIQPIRMHKGIMMESVTFSGRSGHSSNPNLGKSSVDAVHAFLGDVLAFRQQLKDKHQHPGFEIAYPTLNVGAIHGGDSPNRICGHCALNFDLRPLPGMDIEDLHQEIDMLVRKTHHEYDIEVAHRKLVEPVPAFETPADAKLVRLSEQLSGHETGSVAFATEAPFLTSMGIETVVMGAGSIDQAHQPNEFLATEQVKSMANVLQGLIKHYCIEAV